MLAFSPEATAEIIVDQEEHNITMQWRRDSPSGEVGLQKVIDFCEIKYSRHPDFLNNVARNGSHQFTKETYEIFSG